MTMHSHMEITIRHGQVTGGSLALWHLTKRQTSRVHNTFKLASQLLAAGSKQIYTKYAQDSCLASCQSLQWLHNNAL